MSNLVNFCHNALIFAILTPFEAYKSLKHIHNHMSTKNIRVAINGFGRIGRAFFKVAREHGGIEIVAVNDLTSIENVAYLLKYDTAYGVSDFDVKIKSDKTAFIVDGAEVAYVSEKDPTKLPWGKLNVDIVVESTGLFTSGEKAQAHIDAGAKRVVVSAPTKDEAGAAVAEQTVGAARAPVLGAAAGHQLAGGDGQVHPLQHVHRTSAKGERFSEGLYLDVGPGHRYMEAGAYLAADRVSNGD